MVEELASSYYQLPLDKIEFPQPLEEAHWVSNNLEELHRRQHRDVVICYLPTLSALLTVGQVVESDLHDDVYTSTPSYCYNPMSNRLHCPRHLRGIQSMITRDL